MGNSDNCEHNAMVRRLNLPIIGLSLCILLGATMLHASNTPIDVPDYSRLLNFIEMQDRQGPLVAFGAAEKDFDRQLNRENIAFLNSDKALIERIQSQLKVERLKWHLSTSFKQLLVVPENRDEYALLFEQYCRTSVDYLLDRIHMPSPYDQIATLTGPLPSLPVTREPKGITAYLVHNLVDEYIEEYLFFGQDDDQTKIRIKLSNREFDGKIGCYTSRLKIGKNNRFEFIREPYTLWQNSAENPLNVLIVPIEETLHILMRPFTEAAMQVDLEQSKPTRLDEVQQTVDDWMAVEEAIVGGVVSQVMPDLLARFVNQESVGQLTDALAQREEHPQYRLLNQAIQVVMDIGVDQALTVYRKNPRDFKLMLSQPDPPAAMESAQRPQLSSLVN
jgi:hypothetical protein